VNLRALYCSSCSLPFYHLLSLLSSDAVVTGAVTIWKHFGPVIPTLSEPQPSSPPAHLAARTMSDTEYEQEITGLLPFFYPSSQSTIPDPTSAAASLVKHLEAEPLATAALATDLPTFLLHIAAAHPAHTDQVLQTVQILIKKSPSLPLINNWHSSRPNATFKEMFGVAFRDYVNSAIGGPIEVAERESFIAASLLAARARSLEILITPEIVGSLAEGLGFSDEVLYNYQGDVAEIAAIGSCIQLLCGASALVQDLPKRFSKDKIVTALDGLEISSIDTLIKVRFIVWIVEFALAFMVSNIVHEIASGKETNHRSDQRGDCR
jgi:hypothetical protein